MHGWVARYWLFWVSCEKTFTTETQRSAAATKHSGPKKLTAKNAKYAKEEIGLSLAKPQRRKDLGNKIRSGLV
jgi:hypothetical protein